MNRDDPRQRLAASRQQLVHHIEDLKTSVDRELGWKPSLRVWALPLVALAGGALLAGAALGGRRRLKGRRQTRRVARRAETKSRQR